MTAYPMLFEPVFKSMLWGGSRLPPFFGQPNRPEPIGEAWVLSDVDGSPTPIRNGKLAGRTLRELLALDARAILGDVSPVNGRFPLLLKFLDARQELSVQVHPTDAQAHAKRPGQAGKTEAWVVLDADPATSKLYAGFRPGTDAASFRAAMAAGTTPDTLHQFTPTPGDCLFLRAGTVHAIGSNLMIFEVQQTSDITYRLYDWDRIDAKTGRGRELHLDDALECANFAEGPCNPVTPHAEPDGRERLAECEYFTLHRQTLKHLTPVGTPGVAQVLVVVSGNAVLAGERLRPGDVVLLPASAPTAMLQPLGEVTLLSCGLGERNTIANGKAMATSAGALPTGAVPSA